MNGAVYQMTSLLRTISKSVSSQAHKELRKNMDTVRQRGYTVPINNFTTTTDNLVTIIQGLSNQQAQLNKQTQANVAMTSDQINLELQITNMMQQMKALQKHI